jgi:hypothetical protein
MSIDELKKNFQYQNSNMKQDKKAKTKFKMFKPVNNCRDYIACF